MKEEAGLGVERVQYEPGLNYPSTSNPKKTTSKLIQFLSC